jgi:hypothetical protein
MPIRPTYSDVWEDNDFGCEHFQIFRNGFNFGGFGNLQPLEKWKIQELGYGRA